MNDSKNILTSALLVFVTGTLFADEPFRFQEGQHKQGLLNYVNDVPVLFLAGTPEEMAEQHVELVGNSVLPLADYPKKLLQKVGAAKAWPFVVLAGRGILKHAPPDHLRELQSLVDQAENGGESIEVANAMLELRRLGFAGCSTFIVNAKHSKTSEPLFGRNLDLVSMGLLEEYSLVKICRPKGKHAYADIGYPYLIGVISGINEKGLAIATLDVYSSRDDSPPFDPDGTPLMFCFRRILEECSTVQEAEALMREVKRTTWMNLAVCDPNDAAVLEITPKNVVARRDQDGLLSCTNHFRTLNLVTDDRCWRYDSLEDCDNGQKLSVADVVQAMHAVSQERRTVQSMVFEPASLRLHVGFGAAPTTARPLKLLDLKALFAKVPASG